MMAKFLIGCLPFLVSINLAQPQCAGCPLQVDTLSQKQTDLVNWTVSELQGAGGVCKKAKIEVKNFTSQVVAGLKSKFVLVLKHDSDNPSSCGSPVSGEESCTISVWEQSWRKFREIQWDESTCIRDS